MKLRINLLLLISSLLLFFVGVTSLAAVESSPEASEGVLDLRSWDFNKDGPIELNGEWLFFWEKHLSPDSSDKELDDHNVLFQRIPGYWNGKTLGEETLSGKGYASLILKVLLPETTDTLAIKTKDIQTAFRLYVDGEPFNSAGKAGTSEESTKPYYSSVIRSFTTDQNELTIMIHLSNFHHRKGGSWGHIILGYEQDIRSNTRNALLFECFLISCILFMGLYHIFLFTIYRKDKASLFFGIFCLLLAVRTLTTGETIAYTLFPWAGWPVLHRLEYITFFTSLPCFILYLDQLFPKESRKKLSFFIVIISLLFTVFTIVTPSYFYTYSIVPFQLFTLIIGLFVIVKMIKAALKKRNGSWIILSGFIIMFLLIINDILYTNQYVHTGLFLPIGLLAFIFSQSIIIARRFSTAFLTIETQSIEMNKINSSLLAEIKKRKGLELNLLESHEHFAQSRYGIIMGLAKLAEYRDEDTGSHLERMREYCRIIAEKLSKHPDFIGYIKEEYIEDLYQSAILHDIGKVAISDSVLLKPGKLSAEEFEVIKKHPVIGGDAIKNIEARINVQSFLTLGREIAYYHHEKWDGTGYPYGLKDNEIPLSARIVALADVYDALTSERPYKKAFSHEKAKQIILEGKGSHFDPVIVEAFENSLKEFKSIQASFHLESDTVLN